MLLLAFVWLWPGVFAHDLWQDEPLVYAVIRQAAEGGQWWLPQDGGSLFWDVPPLYMWLSLLFLKLFGHLPPYEAVRMVNALLTAVSLAAMGGAGRMLLGRRNGRTAVLVLIVLPGPADDEPLHRRANRYPVRLKPEFLRAGDGAAKNGEGDCAHALGLDGVVAFR